MNRKSFIWTGLGVLSLALFVLGVTAIASDLNRTSQGADCPGKIVCPLSGDEVCKDLCPLVDTNRPDCPGKIECPLTGEFVCRDRCPLGSNKDASATNSRSPACYCCDK